MQKLGARKAALERDYAAKHGNADETAAVVQGLRDKAAEFKKAGGQLYVKQ